MAWREFIGHMKASLIAQKQAVDMSSSMHGIKEKLTAKTVVEIFFFLTFSFPLFRCNQRLYSTVMLQVFSSICSNPDFS